MAALTGMQRLFEILLPKGWFEALEAGTRTFVLECPCGHRRDLWEAGGLKGGGTEERTLARCPACGERRWHRKRKKTPSERQAAAGRGEVHPVFLSGHAWWATVMVWGSAAIVWAIPVLLIGTGTPPLFLAGIALLAFFVGWVAPWFWLTTRYRIAERHLEVYSGAFKVILELQRITEVSKTRKSLGMSLAFDTDFLWVGYPMKLGGVLISPAEESLFLSQLSRSCPHLELRGRELVPRS